MSQRLEQKVPYLCCPDDKAPLEYRPDELRCLSCARVFRVFGVLGDLSAGPDYDTLAYASTFKHVLHCDLSVDALNYADQKARALRIPNTKPIIGSVVPDFECVPFFQESDHDSIQSRLLSRIDQPTRVMYRFARPS